MEVRPFIRQMAKPVIAGWFAGREWKNNEKSDTQPHKILYDFYSEYVIYKCGRRPHNTNWRAAGWGLLGSVNALVPTEIICKYGAKSGHGDVGREPEGKDYELRVTLQQLATHIHTSSEFIYCECISYPVLITLVTTTDTEMRTLQAKFSAPVLSGHGAHPVSNIRGTGSLSRG